MATTDANTKLLAEHLAGRYDRIVNNAPADVSLSNLSSLGSISQTLAGLTPVAAFLYDTRKDSDGGAWRHRCKHLSWYNETLDTAARGTQKEFPSLALIIAQAGNVRIYSLDGDNAEFWMKITGGGSQESNTPILHLNGASKSATSIAMKNGELCVGALITGVTRINFLRDGSRRYRAGGRYDWLGSIVDRDQASVGTLVDSAQGLVDETVHSIDVTVLPDAPIDHETGLPVPTVAVGTDGGTSIIDGPAGVDTVVDYTHSNGTQVDNVILKKDMVVLDDNSYIKGYPLFDADQDFGLKNIIDGNEFFYVPRYSEHSFESFHTSHSSVTINGISFDGKTLGIAHPLRLIYGYMSRIYAEGNTLHAYIDSESNTGWMPPDCKLAALCSTDATSLVDSTLALTILNPNFDNWTAGAPDDWNVLDTPDANNYVEEHVNGLRIVSDDAVAIGIQYGGILTTGKQYVVKVVKSSHVAGLIRLGTVGDYYEIPGSDADGTFYAEFKAETANFRIYRDAGATTDYVIESVEIWEAEPDRSVHQKGLRVVGTITRTPVATGAELVGYGGFLNYLNYLEQPYNSAYDFGSGDFTVCAWIKDTVTNTDFFVDRKDEARTGNEIALIGSVDNFQFKVDTDLANHSLTGTTGNRSSGEWVFVVGVARSGNLYLYINGKENVSMAYTGSVTNTSAILTIGAASNGSSTAGSAEIALVRIGPKALSSDQIAKMYNDEKHMFQENAAVTLRGSSNVVKTIARDEVTGIYHAGTVDARSGFQRLVRVDYTDGDASTILAAHDNIIVEA